MALRLACQFFYANFKGRPFDGLDRPLVSFYPDQRPQFHLPSGIGQEIESGIDGSAGDGGVGGGSGMAPTTKIGHATSDIANDLVRGRGIKSKTHDTHTGFGAGRDTVPVNQSPLSAGRRKTSKFF